MSLVVSNELGLALADRSSMSFIKDNNFRLAVLGFVIYTATFVCEAVRSGINTVPTGQAEAARALGLRFTQVLVIVVLPQALRSVIGPLASVLIALTKNTTVASTIGVSEAALLMSDMIENESNALMSVFALFALGFVALTLPTGLLLGWLARRAGVRR
jgi:glutamate transport system permease protein